MLSVTREAITVMLREGSHEAMAASVAQAARPMTRDAAPIRANEAARGARRCRRAVTGAARAARLR